MCDHNNWILILTSDFEPAGRFLLGSTSPWRICKTCSKLELYSTVHQGWTISIRVDTVYKLKKLLDETRPVRGRQ